MERVTRDWMLLRVAHEVAARGTCSRLQVGVVFSRDGRIISTGYNGAPAGLPHCNHECTCGPGNHGDEALWPHTPFCPWPGPCKVAEHAERNAIAFSARHGVALDGSEMHVTHGPCESCAMSIINAGVVKVTYHIEYRLTDGLQLLEKAGILLQRFHPHSHDVLGENFDE